VAVAKVDTAEQVRHLTATLARQAYRKFELVVLAGKAVTRTKLGALRNALPDVKVRVHTAGSNLVHLLMQAQGGACVWLVNPTDYYGKNFLQDAALTTLYSDADVIGKETHYEIVSGKTKVRLKQPGHDFRISATFSPGSVIAKAGKLGAEQWKALAADHAISISNLRGLSIDRFNYVRRGGEIEEPRGGGAKHPLAEALV
jgi:hypothetical protein